MDNSNPKRTPSLISELIDARGQLRVWKLANDDKLTPEDKFTYQQCTERHSRRFIFKGVLSFVGYKFITYHYSNTSSILGKFINILRFGISPSQSILFKMLAGSCCIWFLLKPNARDFLQESVELASLQSPFGQQYRKILYENHSDVLPILQRLKPDLQIHNNNNSETEDEAQKRLQNDSSTWTEDKLE